MFEMFGRRAKNEDGQPIPPGIPGHIIQPLAHRLNRFEVVVLVQEAVDALEFPPLRRLNSDLIENDLLRFIR
jgi:hypothetical protein